MEGGRAPRRVRDGDSLDAPNFLHAVSRRFLNDNATAVRCRSRPRPPAAGSRPPGSLAPSRRALRLFLLHSRHHGCPRSGPPRRPRPRPSVRPPVETWRSPGRARSTAISPCLETVAPPVCDRVIPLRREAGHTRAGEGGAHPTRSCEFEQSRRRAVGEFLYSAGGEERGLRHPPPTANRKGHHNRRRL